MRAVVAVAALLVAGCAVDAPVANDPAPPPPPTQYPAPVGSVSIVGPPMPIAFVGESAKLTAVVRNFAGTPLAGRAVTWNSSGAATVTISPTGMMRVYSPGDLTVTATSEDQSGHATLAAGYGDSLQPKGGVVEYPGHASLLIVPGGRWVAGRVGLVPTTAPALVSNVSGKTVLPGTYVVFYPRDELFGLPYLTPASAEGTLTLTYDPATLPPGYDQKRLVIMQYRSNALTVMVPTAIDTVAHTITTTHVQGLFGYGVAY